MKFLKIIYAYWMKFARTLGRIQSAIILFLIYFIGIGAVAVVSFILRKDFLDKRMKDKDSFWLDTVQEPVTPETLRRQF